MGYSLQGSSVHRILLARILEWVAMSFSIYIYYNGFFFFLILLILCLLFYGKCKKMKEEDAYNSVLFHRYLSCSLVQD